MAANYPTGQPASKSSTKSFWEQKPTARKGPSGTSYLRDNSSTTRGSVIPATTTQNPTVPGTDDNRGEEDNGRNNQATLAVNEGGPSRTSHDSDGSRAPPKPITSTNDLLETESSNRKEGGNEPSTQTTSTVDEGGRTRTSHESDGSCWPPRPIHFPNVPLETKTQNRGGEDDNLNNHPLSSLRSLMERHPYVSTLLICRSVCICMPLGIFAVGVLGSVSLAVGVFSILAALLLGPVFLCMVVLGCWVWEMFLLAYLLYLSIFVGESGQINGYILREWKEYVVGKLKWFIDWLKVRFRSDSGV